MGKSFHCQIDIGGNHQGFAIMIVVRSVSIFFLGFWLMLSIGCGSSDEPELGMVTGKVTMDSKPLAKVWVGFAPSEGRS